MQVDNKEIAVTGWPIKTVRITDEWYLDVTDPESFVKTLKQRKVKADLFTFWQRLPETKPKYRYYMEWDSVAAIPVKSFNYWWENQIKKNARTAIRKAHKKGVEVKLVDFNDELVKGILGIYNESPIRQGKPFWHYGKDFDTVKKEVSTYRDRSDFIGAYYNDELIGFIKLTYMESYADPMQIISKIGHRDKAPTNALIAKVVEICEEKKIPYFPYGGWSGGSLDDFKRHNGFERIDLPRYYIPLTFKGKLALVLHLHHGFAEILPEKLKYFLKNLRKKWYTNKYAHG